MNAAVIRRFWQRARVARHSPPGELTDLTFRQHSPLTHSPEEWAQALDLIAHMLRLIGDVPVPLEQPRAPEIRDACESWARHVLTLAQPPGTWAEGTKRRAWTRLSQFVVEQRHNEQTVVTTTIAELRQTLVTIVQAVRRAVATETADTLALYEAVDALQAAAVEGSVDELRREAGRTAAQLVGLAAHRARRHRDLADHVTQLTDQVRVLVQDVRLVHAASAKDALTGLLNRASFDAAIRRALAVDLPIGHRLSLALIDLDDLKWVNDQHGHTAGDAALTALADSLRTACRATDQLARISGDEFAAILIDADGDQTQQIAARFLHELWSRNLPVSAGVIRVSASIGIATAQASDTPRSWFERADQRLYRAKGLGKNRVVGETGVVSDGSMPQSAEALLGDGQQSEPVNPGETGRRANY